ncbi:MAG: SdpI family protein [Clostridia bacterium]|nr:SdpI family protein [Clostridia bacterium]
MKKWNKKQFIISTLVIFLPMIAGFLMWNRLPERMITHWGAGGEADGSMGKLAAITSIPGFIFVMHLFCLFMTHLDFNNENQSPKALLIAYWAMPLTSLYAGIMVLGTAMGSTFQPMNWLNLFFGILFILVGNYLPKCRQNGTIGIRLPWTLADEENWNKTHRFGGYTFLIGGLLLLLSSFLGVGLQLPLMMVVLLSICLLTTIYSYKLHKEKQRP